jgi:hypothetical protein
MRLNEYLDELLDPVDLSRSLADDTELSRIGSQRVHRTRAPCGKSRKCEDKDLCRKHGFSDASYYLWRSKFGGMSVSDAKLLTELETGRTFNQPRPFWIQDAGIISNNNPAQPLELPMAILSDDEWASLSIKNVPSTYRGTCTTTTRATRTAAAISRSGRFRAPATSRSRCTARRRFRTSRC